MTEVAPEEAGVGGDAAAGEGGVRWRGVVRAQRVVLTQAPRAEVLRWKQTWNRHLRAMNESYASIEGASFCFEEIAVSEPKPLLFLCSQNQETVFVREGTKKA